MVTSLRLCLVLWLILLSTGSGWAEVNFSELRHTIAAADESLDNRIEALQVFASELTSNNAEELISLVGPFLDMKLTDGQYALVRSLQAKALIQANQQERARDMLDSLLSQSGERSYDERGLYRLYFQRGRAQWRINQKRRLVKALSDFQTALDLSEELDDIALQVSAHDALGLIYKKLNEMETAMVHYTFILRFSEDDEKVAQATFSLAQIFDNDPAMQDTALAYMNEAREQFKQSNNKSNEAKAVVGLANAYRYSKRFEEAKNAYQSALNMGLEPKEKTVCHEYLGSIAYNQGDLETALAQLDSAARWDLENNNRRALYIATKRGKVLIALGQAETGLQLCDSMLAQALADSNLSDKIRTYRLEECHSCISKGQLAIGLYEEAWLSRDMEDSIVAIRGKIEAEEAAKLKLELYEYRGLREEQNRLVMDKQKDDQNRLLFLLVLLLIAFAIFITSRYRFTRKQSALISTQRQQLQDRQRELIRANAELEIALNHKAVFLSNMSHEIRTPLNAIVGMSNLATKEEMAEGARKYLRNIVTASSNLIDIVNDILDFSKLEAGKLEIAQEPFSVSDALEVAENVMRIPAEQKGLEFTVDAHPQLPSHLLGDASRLNQVLINLIGNAIKFTLEGGVTMKAEVAPLPTLPAWCPKPEKQHKDWFVVRVTDTGIGIPEDKLEKIFESFNQGDQLKTRKFGGTGLGLSISKQIVELQGGVIWVESVEGEGSTFAFALPAFISEAEVVEETENAETGEIGPLRILIAEDNPFNVIVTEDTLNSELDDLTIGKAENGRVAFEKVRDEEWDLVLMDIHMPEMSGLEATAAIRKLPGVKASTIIIAMTASVLREETDSYMRHGMDGFVPKPFQVDQLTSEIRRLRMERKNNPSGPAPFPALRILIAEDNPFNVIVAEDTLRSELPDVTIGKAENGKLAWEAVRDGDWDIVLMDIAMPEMTGLEATAAIRKLPDPKRANTTIIAMTASVLKEETDHYLKQGMNGFVPKPFKVEQLLGEIQRAHLDRG